MWYGKARFGEAYNLSVLLRAALLAPMIEYEARDYAEARHEVRGFEPPLWECDREAVALGGWPSARYRREGGSCGSRSPKAVAARPHSQGAFGTAAVGIAAGLEVWSLPPIKAPLNQRCG
jgi:hypothetical protein